MEILTPPAPQPQRAGSLLAAANTPTQTLQRAGFGGHGYQALACTGWRLHDACTGEEIDVDADTRGALVQGVPYAIQVEDECTTLGNPDLEARARALLGLVEGAAIAREFWTGDLAAAAALEATGEVQDSWEATPHLVSADTIVLTTSAVTPLAGLALVEDALGQQLAGSPGLIHMTRGTLTFLAVPAGLRREGDLILTMTDQRVVADAGYPGTGPTGAAPAAGNAWLYGTARPTIVRSDITVPGQVGERLNRATNRQMTRAERYALTTLSCGVVAAQITLES